MGIFRLQDNVPDTYIKNSRDFQLLCNVFDLANSQVKYSTDTMRYITDTEYCDSRLLQFLRDKVGFISSIQLDDFEERIILKAFPYLIRNKGSIRGIVDTINVFLKSQKIKAKTTIRVVNSEIRTIEDDETSTFYLYPSDTYLINISILGNITRFNLLKELLSFIVPTGYHLQFKKFTDEPTITKHISRDEVQIELDLRQNNDSVRELSNTDNTIFNNISRTTTVDSQLDFKPQEKPFKKDYNTDNSIGEYTSNE